MLCFTASIQSALLGNAEVLHSPSLPSSASHASTETLRHSAACCKLPLSPDAILKGLLQNTQKDLCKMHEFIMARRAGKSLKSAACLFSVPHLSRYEQTAELHPQLRFLIRRCSCLRPRGTSLLHQRSGYTGQSELGNQSRLHALPLQRPVGHPHPGR